MAFRSNYLGRLKQFEIPRSIFREEKLILQPAGLAVLLGLCEVAESKQPTGAQSTVEVKIKQSTLSERTGYAPNRIIAGVSELESKQFIKPAQTRRVQGEFGSNVYELLNPDTGKPLHHGGRNILFANKLPYIPVPKVLIREFTEAFSFAKMTGSELRAYVTLLYLANRERKTEFDISVNELRKLTGLSTRKTLEEALDALAYEKRLAEFSNDRATLFNPLTGLPFEEQSDDDYADSSNYTTTQAKGRTKQLVFNSSDPEYTSRLLTACGLSPLEQNDGEELAINCPFHADSTPSCYVNKLKRVFYCHGCQAKGTLLQLVMRTMNIDKGRAMQMMADATGIAYEFNQPDKNAEAIYTYRGSEGALKKQVLRYPDKSFKQRRPAKGGGWIWDANGVKPLLYNRDQFVFASVICITEGEKDADTVTKLKLTTEGGWQMIGSTSGGANSWVDHLADDFKGKKVVVMPDADEAGGRFGAAVAASLKARGIEHRLVSFNDTGANDVSEFMDNGGTREQVAKRIGNGWVSANSEFESINDAMHNSSDI